VHTAIFSAQLVVAVFVSLLSLAHPASLALLPAVVICGVYKVSPSQLTWISVDSNDILHARTVLVADARRTPNLQTTSCSTSRQAVLCNQTTRKVKTRIKYDSLQQSLQTKLNQADKLSADRSLEVHASPAFFRSTLLRNLHLPLQTHPLAAS
jgi:hypothetical protein